MSTPNLVTGLATSYDLDQFTPLDIDLMIYMLSADDTPMLTGMGADGLTVIGSEPVDNTTYHWQSDALLTPRSQLAAAVTTGQGFIVVQPNERLHFSTGDSLKIAGTAKTERLRVSGYGVTAHSLLVTRDYGGTTAEAYASGAAVIGLGTVLSEGADPENARTRDRTSEYNVTQIFGPTAIHMTGTEQVIKRYGVPNEMARQVFHRTKEHAISIEQAALYGFRYDSGSGDEHRMMGGLEYFLTANHNATDTQLTVASIQSGQKLAYAKGGLFTTVMTHPFALDDLNDTADTQRVRQELVDSRRGRVPVTVVTTEFGDVTVARNRWCLPTDAFGISRENVKWATLRPFILERLAKTGDADKVQILRECGLIVKGQRHMARWSALAYS